MYDEGRDGAHGGFGGKAMIESAEKKAERDPSFVAGKSPTGGVPFPHGYDLVVIAASAGGIEALEMILSSLPANFPVPIAIVQHRTARLPNLMAQVLARWTPLAVKTADQSEVMRPGTVYLAPPDLHLTVHPDRTFGLSDGRKIRHVRSSANPLFSSAAEVFGKGLIAVVLTGGDRDATDGVQSVRAHGGMVLAQDEATSWQFAMPRSAIETGSVNRVVPLAEIAPALIGLVMGPADDARADGPQAPRRPSTT
jgi:two-component system, chemotaxis family, protein-glutamate methylesterase/glutaminase